MGFLLMGVLLFLGIVGGFSAVSFLFSSAFRDGGIWGILFLVAWIIFCLWVASKSSNDKGKKK